MKALMIKDLTASTELDSKAMAAVSGGHSRLVWGGPGLSVDLTKVDTKSVIASQDLAQVANVDVANGINAAFVSGLTSNVFTDQYGSNNINVR